MPLKRQLGIGAKKKGGCKMFNRNEETRPFQIPNEKNTEMKAILREVYNALSEKGYNPINQIVGYILSEDPTYITTHNNARALIRKIDRDELLKELVTEYLRIGK